MAALRQFRYFLALAEELHFARAAERLNMAQPPLSRQIHALERELGVRLFHRTKRKVELTEAGALFLPEAKAAVAHADRATQLARRAARGEVGFLEVAYASSVPQTAIFPRLIREYRRACPGVVLALCEMTTARQLAALEEGRLDLGLVRPPFRERPKSVAFAPLLGEPFYVALREDHRLAASASIAPPALAKEPFILYPRHIGTGLHDQVMRICQAAGFEPNVAQEAQQMTTIVALVSAGLGIALVPASMRQLAAEGVVYRPLTGTQEEAAVMLAYRLDERAPAALSLIRLASALVAEGETPPREMARR